MKKIISVLLAAALALGIATSVPLSVGAAETELSYVGNGAESAEPEAGENGEINDAPEAAAAPAAPVIKLSNTVNGLTAAWAQVENAKGYRVFCKAATDEEWSEFDTADTGFVIPDAESGVLYYVKVMSLGADGAEGEFSKVKSMTCVSRAVITGLSYNGSSNTLAWDIVGGANKYQIAKKKTGDTSYTYYTTTSTSFEDDDVLTAYTYYYQVRAMYATENNGTAYGAWSAKKSTVTLTRTNISLSNKSNGIRAQWNAVNGASGYDVFFRSSPDAEWSSAHTSNTYYPLFDVESGTLYYFQVRPFAGKLGGAYSKVKSMTFIARPSVTLSNIPDGVKVSWDSVNGANRFQIAKKKKGDTSYSYFYTEDTSFVDSEVAGNTNYLYQVRAMYATESNGTAYGAWSSTKSILNMVQPTVRLSNKSNGIRAEWNKTAGAEKYVVYFKEASASSWQSVTTSDNYYPLLSVSSGVLYSVQVRPVGGGAYGPFSKVKSMTFIGPAALRLYMSGGDLTAGWNSVPGANKYQIVKIKKADSSYEYFFTSNTSYTDKTAAGSNGLYSYQVRAMYETANNGTAYGAWSSAWNFNNGQIVFDGYQIIDGSKYYFQNGVVQKNGILDSSRDGYCYADKNGKIDTTFRGAVTSNGADWIVMNGTATKVVNASDRNLFRAMQIVTKLTNNSMTNEQKLRVCLDYLKKSYVEKNPRIPHYTGMDWPIIYANDILANGVGNCFSYGSVFCYMAKAIGYTNVYACSSGGHGWAEIDGLVYDPEWARHRFQYSYFALSYNTQTDVNYKGGIAAGEPWMHVKV